jgi:predicted small metal-binding protein
MIGRRYGTVRGETHLAKVKGGAMNKVIKCVCGFVVRGDSDEELLDAAETHIQEMHPELRGKVTREDLVSMVELVA